MDYSSSTMSDLPTKPATATATAHRWTARLGLLLVGAILVSCFGLLIAASGTH